MEFVSPQITIIPKKKYFTNEVSDYFCSKVGLDKLVSNMSSMMKIYDVLGL